MGVLFFVLKLYKNVCMSNVNGIIFTLLRSDGKFQKQGAQHFVIVSVVVFVILCVVYKIFKLR